MVAPSEEHALSRALRELRIPILQGRAGSNVFLTVSLGAMTNAADFDSVVSHVNKEQAVVANARTHFFSVALQGL